MKKLFGLRELKFFVGLIMVVGGLVGMVYSASIPADFDNLFPFILGITFSSLAMVLGFIITERQWMGVRQ